MSSIQNYFSKVLCQFPKSFICMTIGLSCHNALACGGETGSARKKSKNFAATVILNSDVNDEEIENARARELLKDEIEKRRKENAVRAPILLNPAGF